MRAQDIDDCLALFDAVAAERVHIGTEPGYDRVRYCKSFEAAVGDAAQLVFVAVVGERVIGQLSVREHAEFGPTIGMMVAATHRRRGLGRQLMRAAMNWARERRLEKLSLLVFPHNHAAISLYRSLGFEEVERFERDATRATGEVWDTILMQVRLERKQ